MLYSQYSQGKVIPKPVDMDKKQTVKWKQVHVLHFIYMKANITVAVKFLLLFKTVRLLELNNELLLTVPVCSSHIVGCASRH